MAVSARTTSTRGREAARPAYGCAQPFLGATRMAVPGSSSSLARRCSRALGTVGGACVGRCSRPAVPPNADSFSAVSPASRHLNGNGNGNSDDNGGNEGSGIRI
ncbi:hypothetical protein GCM10010358_79560 [Streptomyces minutiscleroticus]|uniref:Uncharacterized protein n=1 Tax=Streptomyces minutiscleroticus TaxID=68238 RepID=A0A918P2G0_9ACTN|nr:hypothetical protein GCM10010358_79560 [Streptomyces minutiscleroticus]